MSFHCPLCNSTVFEQVPGTPTLDGRIGALYSCASCSMVFTDPKRIGAKAGGIPGQPQVRPDFRRDFTLKK